MTLDLRRAQSADDLTTFCTLNVASPLSPSELVQRGADAHWMALGPSATVEARCSLWWSDVPELAGERVGLVGHFSTADAAASARLLEHCCAELAGHGCTLAIGPLDGSTFRRYRLLTERGTEPLFLLEPDNPDDWPDHWTMSGFAPLAEYCSTLVEGLDPNDPDTVAARERTASAGVTIRRLDVGRFEQEIRRLYRFATLAFQRNFLYTPISEEDFVRQYAPMQAVVRSELVLIAEYEGEPVGFLFGIPDLNQLQRGVRCDTAIIKTIAADPHHSGKGIGVALVTECQTAAARLGMGRAIHALMHVDNPSRVVSVKRGARVIRRYTLYARRLDGAR